MKVETDTALHLFVDADGMAFIHTEEPVPLNHLRRVIVGAYSQFIKKQYKPIIEEGLACSIEAGPECDS